jgi:membrane protein YqaA with SNARE-associated domain
MNVKKIKEFFRTYLGILAIGGIIIFFFALTLCGINFGQLLADLIMWFYHTFGDLGIYIGVFLISIFGNFTIFFPVPYVVALIVISAVIGYPGVNPIILGLAGGLGATIGEIISWLIGKGSQGMVKDSERIKRMKGYIEKGWAPILIFVFAATPLPDDAFLIVLGMVSYNLLITIFYCFLGKFVLCFLCSALPIWFVGTPIGDFLFSLFGIDLEAAKTGVVPATSPLEIIRSSIIWAATLIIFFLLIYVDWSKLMNRILKRTEETLEQNGNKKK